MQHPDFKTIQGVLALEDCPIEKGVTVLVPGSSKYFSEYNDIAGRGEYVELTNKHKYFDEFTNNFQEMPIRAGNILTWDSRITHANSSNISNETRFVALVAAGLAQSDPELAAIRNKAFVSGEGLNVREAFLHASKKPRYSNNDALNKIRGEEKLSILGEFLYGERAYPSFV